MAAPFLSTPFQPYVYQSSQEKVTAFQIIGGEGQVVQIMLKSQEKITLKPGAVCYMSESIQMDNIIFHENEAGVWQWLLGKNVSSTILTNIGADDGYVGISAPSLGRIIPVDLANFGGELLIQPDTFLCSVNDVAITNTLDLRAHVFTGVEVFLKQKLVGHGLAFLVGGGSVVQKILDAGEVLVADVASIIAMTNTIDFRLQHANPVRRALFGGENQITACLTGPGVVFIQSLPFHRFSQQIVRRWKPVHEASRTIAGSGEVDCTQSFPRLAKRLFPDSNLGAQITIAEPPGGKENQKVLVLMMVFFLIANVIILSTLILSGI